MSALTKIGLAAVGACLCAGLGVVGAVAYLAPAAPSSLAKPAQVPDFPVGVAQFDDARPVELELSRGDDLGLVTRMPGRITRSYCVAGEPVDSGKAVVMVNGTPLIGLATSVPLWRDLAVGDTGEDVTALQTELARLGYEVVTTGPLRTAALRALRDLYRAAGDTSATVSQVSVARLVWLPAPSVTTSECAAAVGSTIAEGDVLATVPGRLEGVSLVDVPEDLLSGDRELALDGITVALADPAQPISDPQALTQLSTLPSLQPGKSDDEASRVVMPTATLRLATPVDVSIVPPGSIVGASGSAVCVVSDGWAVRVTVVGSQLGQTYVLFEESPPPVTVDTNPVQSTRCV